MMGDMKAEEKSLFPLLEAVSARAPSEKLTEGKYRKLWAPAALVQVWDTGFLLSSGGAVSLVLVPRVVSPEAQWWMQAHGLQPRGSGIRRISVLQFYSE